jgi:hypothetical protein
MATPFTNTITGEDGGKSLQQPRCHDLAPQWRGNSQLKFQRGPLFVAAKAQTAI